MNKIRKLSLALFCALAFVAGHAGYQNYSTIATTVGTTHLGYWTITTPAACTWSSTVTVAGGPGDAIAWITYYGGQLYQVHSSGGTVQSGAVAGPATWYSVNHGAARYTSGSAASAYSEVTW